MNDQSDENINLLESEKEMRKMRGHQDHYAEQAEIDSFIDKQKPNKNFLELIADRCTAVISVHRRQRWNWLKPISSEPKRHILARLLQLKPDSRRCKWYSTKHTSKEEWPLSFTWPNSTYAAKRGTNIWRVETIKLDNATE